MGAPLRGLGLTKVALSALTDARHPKRIVHSQLDMIRQQIYGLVRSVSDSSLAVKDAAESGPSGALTYKISS